MEPFSGRCNGGGRSGFGFLSAVADDMRAITGGWTIEVRIGKKKGAIPIEVLTKRRKQLNRAPVDVKKVSFAKKPVAGTVPLCKLKKSPLVGDDPDYDVVSIEWTWTVNGKVVREVTTAAHTGALAVGMFDKGDTLECAARPADGDLFGNGEATSAKVK